MKLRLASYQGQAELWPRSGRYILARFDAESVIVYQAYRPTIGEFAAANGYFGDGFSLSRMIWIKSNFLWMMYRCGWASKEGQEVVLAVRLRRAAFDSSLYASDAEWKGAVARSDVRLQWDPDHHPSGAPLTRRAIQLGLRGKTLEKYSREGILSVESVSDFVREQGSFVAAKRLSESKTPAEDVYPVPDPAVARRLGLDAPSRDS